jgi:zinc transporter ZupT
MLLKTLVLFFTPLLSGMLTFLFQKSRTMNFKLILVFAGAYLFSITVIHILPELFRQPVASEYIGLCVLGGFFLQQFLEYFTSGIEHGHIHTQTHEHAGHHHSHHHDHNEPKKTLSALVLLTALCIHAFLEGGMLAETNTGSVFYDINAILLGIALHRAPAAFALMTVLTHQLGSKQKALPYLVGFSLAAPIGLFISTYLSELEILSDQGMMMLYAVVSGNFLHISTTIVFESSPEHYFNARKLAVAVFGALVAVVVEYII